MLNNSLHSLINPTASLYLPTLTQDQPNDLGWLVLHYFIGLVKPYFFYILLYTFFYTLPYTRPAFKVLGERSETSSLIKNRYKMRNIIKYNTYYFAKSNDFYFTKTDTKCVII